MKYLLMLVLLFSCELELEPELGSYVIRRVRLDYFKDLVRETQPWEFDSAEKYKKHILSYLDIYKIVKQNDYAFQFHALDEQCIITQPLLALNCPLQEEPYGNDILTVNNRSTLDCYSDCAYINHYQVITKEDVVEVYNLIQSNLDYEKSSQE